MAEAGDGLKKGFLNQDEPVDVPADVPALRERLRRDLAEADRLRAQPNDESRPYETRYEERRVLQRLRRAAEAFGAGEDGDADASRAAAARDVLGIVDALLGINFMSTEEPGAASAPLSRALEVLGEGPEHALHRCDALNHLGTLCAEREQHDDALRHLSAAKELYARFSAADAPPLCPPDGAAAADAAASLERLHTHTLFFLAQVYGHLGQPRQSATHAHATLRRQLGGEPEFERHEWCKNAISLAAFYTSEGAHDVAEHCLHAAERVIGGIPSEQRREASGEPVEKYAELRANLHLAWAELHRAVLKAAASSAPAEAEAEAGGGAGGGIAISLADERLRFDGFLKGLPAPSAQCASPAVVRSFDAAREVFKAAAVRVREAKAHFVLDGFVSDHYACCNLEARLYGALVLHETDAARMLAMHKRRAAALEPLADALNPKAYHSIMRQLLYDLAGTYTDALDVRFAKLQGVPPARAAPRLKPLAEKAAEFYARFFAMFNDADGNPPERVDAENEEVFVSAHFALARACGKVETVESLTQSLEAYRFAVDYADKNEIGFMRAEIDLAREMVELLPTKIAALGRKKA